MANGTFDLANYEGSEWFVNGVPADQDTNEFLDDKTTYELASLNRNCPYCAAPFRFVPFNDTAEESGYAQWHYNRIYLLRLCSRCAHWEFEGTEGGNKCMDPQQTILATSVVATFDPSLPPACSSELAQHLRRHPEYWYMLPPQRMETLVADIFRANYRRSEVVHVGGPGDRGVDVVFVNSDGIRWLVQVKRRARPDKTEGFATIQSILGALALQGHRHGIVVSTANSFSYQARRAQREAQQYGYIIELVDKGMLERIVGTLLPTIPWCDIFSRPALSHINEDVRMHFGGPESAGQMNLF